jgi:hypothetical protein
MTEQLYQQLQRIDFEKQQEYQKIPLANPKELQAGDRVVFNNNNRWTCSRRVDCTCECGKPHSGWIMIHKYQTQLWWDNDVVWKSTVMLKDWPEKKIIMDKYREQTTEAIRNKK